MKAVRLHLDMADPGWFEPYTTVLAEIEDTTVEFFYRPFGREIRAAKLQHDGRELVLYTVVENAWSWSTGFGAVIADMGKFTWSEAVARGFEGVPLEAKGKAVVQKAL